MATPPPFHLFMPPRWQVPLLVSAPHSGTQVPVGFPMPGGTRGKAVMNMNDTGIHGLALPAAAQLGFPVLSSRYIRAFIDLNRNAEELDPALIADLPAAYALPDPHGRVAAGLGLIPRLSDGRQTIYEAKISFAAVQSRIRRFYEPYHRQLQTLIGECMDKFGCCLLIDLHSMPPISPAPARRALALTPGQPTMRQRRFADSPLNIVLGDNKGRSLHARLAADLLTLLQAKGLTVSHNRPYSGGWITKSNGQAGTTLQSLQLEVCRGLYPGDMGAPRAKALEAVFAALAQSLSTFQSEPVTVAAE